jgi:tetratricopeptide (TPR) repeat protein
LLRLARFDEAEQAARELQRINPDSPGVHFSNYFFAFFRRDQAAMDREVQWARGKPEEAQLISYLAITAMYFGKLKEAEELHKRSVEMFKNQNRQENASGQLLNLAGNLVLLQKCQQAKDNAKAAMALFRGQLGLPNAALIYAACNDASQAQELFDEARAANPKNTVLTSIGVPMLRAVIEKTRGNFDEALQLLEPLRSYEGGAITGLGPNYLRGYCYLQQRRGNEAIAEFKKIIDNPGIDPFSPARPLAHLGLARAAVVNGDTAGARKAYQDFFALWKDADQDLPVLVQARKEYEQLK